MFNERLKSFRKDLDLNKRQMAKELDVTEGYYNVIENAKKNPSKNFIDKLVLLSEKPEEYWIYGIEEDKEYIDSRNEFKCTHKALEQLFELGLNPDHLFENETGDKIIIEKGSIEQLIIAALKADIEHIKLKSNEQ